MKYYNPENEYLISNFKNDKMKYSNYRREKFDKIMENLEMEHTPHECRHTFASLMDSVNANKLCVKLIIGHSSSDLTEKVYTHKTLRELADMFGSVGTVPIQNWLKKYEIEQKSPRYLKSSAT